MVSLRLKAAAALLLVVSALTMYRLAFQEAAMDHHAVAPPRAAPRGGRGTSEQVPRNGGGGSLEQALRASGRGSSEQALRTGGRGSSEQAPRAGGSRGGHLEGETGGRGGGAAAVETRGGAAAAVLHSLPPGPVREAAWRRGEESAWARLLAAGAAVARSGSQDALCVATAGGVAGGGGVCVEPALQVAGEQWGVWFVPCDNSRKGWRFRNILHQGFAQHPGVRLVANPREAHALVWLPTCASSFRPAQHNLTEAHLKRLAALEESDHPGMWPQLAKHLFAVYFKRSWVRKYNGTHLEQDAGTARGKGREVAQAEGLSDCDASPVFGCGHHGSRAWANRDSLRRGHVFAPLPYALWDNYTHGLTIGALRPLDVVCTVRTHATVQPARTRVVSWLVAATDRLGLVDGVERVIGDTGGHRQKVDAVYFDLMRRSKIVVTCNPSHWDGDFRLFEALSSGALVMTDELHTPSPHAFIDGEHLVVYDSHDQADFSAKVDYYVRHPEEAAVIAARGLAHALKYHRAVTRADYVLRERRRLRQASRRPLQVRCTQDSWRSPKSSGRRTTRSRGSRLDL
ncbi:hypothetical protein M885DRAFT_506121 [Pelagophyceae sp. CCMP2097]|nr:hypothetical protein M885DRAFT_506121 [Pelagophyceae sp. CCMP2097]